MSNFERHSGMKQIRGYNGFNHPRIATSVKIHRKEWESEVQRKMTEFQASDETRLAFPAMDNQQRKRVHEIASRYGMLSHSEGRDPNRFVVTMKKKKPTLTSSLTIETAPVELSPAMHAKIREFIKEYPIGKFDVENHLSVQLAMKSHKSKSHTRKFDRPQPMLIPPKSNHTHAMMEQRKRLPAFNMKLALLDAISRNRVVLITGGTGCGKTTQVPQFLLEEANFKNRPLRIICTQPRRLPAIAVADRVARERGENIGGTVGYHIRLEMRTSASTVLTYCTSGVLLRMLTQDDAFKNVSHIILDEIHEREQNTDYLLIALKQALAREKDLKIVLMSATMEGNLDIFKNYFGDVKVEHIDIPSRLYKVDKLFLGDILALTGYTPTESVFSSGSFAPIGFSQSFPHMSTWGTPDEHPLPLPQPGYEPPQKPTFDLGVQYSTPPPTRPVQSDLFDNLAQQLTTQAAPQNPQPNQNVPQYAQAGMQHAATWAAGMDQSQYNDYPQNEECIMLQSTTEDHTNLQTVLGDDVVPSGAHFPQSVPNNYSTPPPDWRYRPQMSAAMQYFPSPMNGTICPPVVPPAMLNTNFTQAHPCGSQPMTQQAMLASPFGRAVREQHDQMDKMRYMLQMALPNRTPNFQLDSLNVLNQGLASQGLSSEYLADAYKKLGGQQYADCVDVDLVTCLARYIMDSPIDGAILIFLPGYDDIVDVKEKLSQACQNCMLRPDIYTLHSQMNTADQNKVFERSKEGLRKVILSTNIAEASLTIDDVVFVIDSGKVKEKTYDHNSRISQLKVCWIARSNAEQRSGRAGRCREGFCFRLYGQTDYNMMPATQKAEMQRSAIHEVCLHAKIFAPEGMSVRNFLSMAPEPPPAGAIDNSMVFLEQLGAFYSEASTSDIDVTTGGPAAPEIEPEMTDLGLIIAKLPLEPQLARMLLFGLTLKVLTPVVTLVAALSHRDPFVIPIPDERERCNKIRDHFSGLDYSDHLALLRAITEFESCKHHGQQSTFCRNNFLNLPAMKMILGIRKQLLGELKRANLIYDPNTALNDAYYNQYSDRWPMVQVAITAGCYPGIGFTKSGTKLRKIRTSYDKSAGLHPSSVIKRQVISQAKKNDMGTLVEYLAYQELAQLDEGLTLKTVTVVPPVATILATGHLRMKQSVMQEFSLICEKELLEVEEDMEKEQTGGPDEYQHHNFGTPSLPYLVIDDWFALKGTHPALRDILRLRFQLMRYFLDVIAEPKSIHDSNKRHDMLLDTVAYVLDEDHRRVGFKPVEAVDFFNREKITRQAPPEEKNHSTDNRNNYNDGGRYHANNRGYNCNQDRGQQYGNSQQYSNEQSNNDFLVNSGYTSVELPNQIVQEQYRPRSNYDRPEQKYGYNSRDQYRNGAGQDSGERVQNYGQHQSKRYNSYSRPQSPRYDGYSRQQSPRYNVPADDNYDDGGYRHDGARRSYTPPYDREQYDQPDQEAYYDERENRPYRSNQADDAESRYDRDDRNTGPRYNEQRRDNMPNRNNFNNRDYPRRGASFPNRRGDGNQRGRGGGNRGNFHNKTDFNPPRGDRSSPDYKPSTFAADHSYDDGDYAPSSRTSPVSFTAKSQDVRRSPSSFPGNVPELRASPPPFSGNSQDIRCQDVRFEQGKPPTFIRNKQSTSRNQNYNRDRNEQRDDRGGYKQSANRNNENRNSFPHKYDDDPRGQDNGAPRQYYGSRRQNDGSRRQKDVPRRPEGSVSRDEYKDDSYGYGGIRRNDNRSRNEAVNPPQRNYDDGQRRHDKKERYVNNTSNSSISRESIQKFQPPPQVENNRKPRNSPTGEDPPPDPVIRNDPRNSMRSKKKFYAGKGPYRGDKKAANDQKGDDGTSYDHPQEEKGQAKYKKNLVFENRNYKRQGPANRP